MWKFRLAHENGGVMGNIASMAIDTDRKGKSNIRYKTQLLSRFCRFLRFLSYTILELFRERGVLFFHAVVFCFSCYCILVFIHI